MTTAPQNGSRYRYTGELRAYRGLVGTASSIIQKGRCWELILTNVKEWPPMGLIAGLACVSYEIEAVEEAPKPEPATAAKPVDAYDGPESVLVGKITDAAKEAGYEVCVVGQRNAKDSGTTVGFPDMAFRRKSWPAGMLCALEVKVKGGRLSAEQITLHEAGWSRIVWSVEGAMDALVGFEEELRHGL